jgi:hypothetical protein
MEGILAFYASYSLLCSVMVCFHLKKSESEVAGFDSCHRHVIHLFCNV